MSPSNKQFAQQTKQQADNKYDTLPRRPADTKDNDYGIYQPEDDKNELHPSKVLPNSPVTRQRSTAISVTLPLSPVEGKDAKVENKLESPANILFSDDIVIGNQTGVIVQNDVIKKALHTRIGSLQDSIRKQKGNLHDSIDAKFPQDNPTKETPQCLSELEYKAIFSDGEQIAELKDERDAMEIKQDYIQQISRSRRRSLHQDIITQYSNQYQQDIEDWSKNFLQFRINQIKLKYNEKINELNNRLAICENRSRINELAQQKKSLHLEHKDNVADINYELCSVQRDTEWNKDEISSITAEINKLTKKADDQISLLTESISNWKRSFLAFRLQDPSLAAEETKKWDTERKDVSKALKKFKDERSRFEKMVGNVKLLHDHKISEFSPLLDICKTTKWTIDDYKKIRAHLLQKDSLFHEDQNGYTPLHYACMLYDISLVKEIIKTIKKSDNPDKQKFLVTAINSAFAAFLKKNPQHQDHSDTLELISALEITKQDILNLDHIKSAVKYNNLSALRWLVERQYETDDKGFRKYTAHTKSLHHLLFNELFIYACDKSYKEIVNYLMEIMKKDFHIVRPALENAFLEGTTEVISVFTENGFIPDAKSEQRFIEASTFSPVVVTEENIQQISTNTVSNSNNDCLEMEKITPVMELKAINATNEPLPSSPKGVKADEIREQQIKNAAAVLDATIEKTEKLTAAYSRVVVEMQTKLAKHTTQLDKLKGIKASLTAENAGPEQRASILLRVSMFSPRTPSNTVSPKTLLSPKR